MWHVITDCCQNGCYLVVLVRSPALPQIVAFCRDCGAAWLTPEDYENNGYVIGAKVFPAGVEQPTSDEVATSIWRRHIQQTVEEAAFSTLAELNADLARQST